MYIYFGGLLPLGFAFVVIISISGDSGVKQCGMAVHSQCIYAFVFASLSSFSAADRVGVNVDDFGDCLDASWGCFYRSSESSRSGHMQPQWRSDGAGDSNSPFDRLSTPSGNIRILSTMARILCVHASCRQQCRLLTSKAVGDKVAYFVFFG